MVLNKKQKKFLLYSGVGVGVLALLALAVKGKTPTGCASGQVAFRSNITDWNNLTYNNWIALDIKGNISQACATNPNGLEIAPYRITASPVDFWYDSFKNKVLNAPYKITLADGTLITADGGCASQSPGPLCPEIWVMTPDQRVHRFMLDPQVHDFWGLGCYGYGETSYIPTEPYTSNGQEVCK